VTRIEYLYYINWHFNVQNVQRKTQILYVCCCDERLQQCLCLHPPTIHSSGNTLWSCDIMQDFLNYLIEAAATFFCEYSYLSWIL